MHAVGVAELCHGQFLVGINLDDREVSVLIHAHNLCGIARGVSIQLHLNLGGLLDNVIISEDVAALVHNHAGSEAAVRLGRPIGTAVKEAIEEILHGIVLVVWLRAALSR